MCDHTILGLTLKQWTINLDIIDGLSPQTVDQHSRAISLRLKFVEGQDKEALVGVPLF